MKKRLWVAFIVLFLVSGLLCGYMLIKMPRIPPARIADAGGIWAQAAKKHDGIDGIDVFDAAKTPDGGICIAGTAYRNKEICDDDFPCKKLYVSKFDKTGKQLWFRTVGGMHKWTYAVTATPDGGCAATGMAETIPKTVIADEDPTGFFFDLFYVKFDSAGKRIFYKQFSNARHKTLGGEAIAALPNGDLIIAANLGPIFRKYPNCPWMLRVSPDGRILHQTYDCSKRPLEYDNMSLGKSGTIYTFRLLEYEHKRDYKHNVDYFFCKHWFSKIDPSFKTILNVEEPFKQYGGMCLHDAVTNDDGGFAVGFTHTRKANDSDMFLLIKYGPDFTPVWMRTYETENYLAAREIIATSDGGTLIGGSYVVRRTRTAPFLMKTDPAGKLQWLKYYDPEIFAGLISVHEKKSGGYIAVLNPHYSKFPKICSGKKCPQFWLLNVDKNGNGPRKLNVDKPLVLNDY